MKKTLENLTLFAPVIIINLIALVWILVSWLDDYFLTTFYLLYVAIIVAGFGIIKYRKNTIYLVPIPLLIKELKLGVFLSFLMLVITVCVHIFTPITLGIILILYFIIFVYFIELHLKYQFISKHHE